MKTRDHADLFHALFGVFVGCFFSGLAYIPEYNPDELIGIVLCYIVSGVFFFWGLAVFIIWAVGKKLHEVMFGNYETRRYF